MDLTTTVLKRAAQIPEAVAIEDGERRLSYRQLVAASAGVAAGLRGAEAAGRWVAARWALRGVLGRYLGEPPEAIALEAGEHGKPHLADAPERLRFNLSHSGSRALVAVCRDREVGVDIERIEPRRDLLALAERSLDPAAAARVRDAAPADRTDVFYAAWAAHEARLKCLGTGLGTPAGDDPVAVTAISLGADYAAALALGGGGVPTPRFYSLPPG